jgi:hypothetical protein
MHEQVVALAGTSTLRRQVQHSRGLDRFAA